MGSQLDTTVHCVRGWEPILERLNRLVQLEEDRRTSRMLTLKLPKKVETLTCPG